MERRRLLQLLAASGLSAPFGIGPSSIKAAIASGGGHRWGYVGGGGPEAWGDLSSKYSTCRFGMKQSPIDLHAPFNAELDREKVHYNPIPLTILNNGHTIQVNAIGNNYIELDDEKFNLLQFHFHHPSEHTVNGSHFPMEVHFVHANEKGELAVLGAFLKEGAENALLSGVWNAMPHHKKDAETITGANVDIPNILPRDRSMFRYFGSLTTPPCTEIVKWVLLQTPIEVSAAQIDAFKDIFPLNARPTQPINRRFLLESS